MMISKQGVVVALAGMLVLAAPALSFAANRGEADEQTALQGTNVTLAQAIAAAEQQTGGKAFDAGTDTQDGKPRVIVETNGPKGVQSVIFDAQNGQVIGGHAGGEED